jgi:hypothetical protein
MRVVGALADILPDAEEIDLRWILEALARLHDRAQGADLLAVKHPGVIFAAGRRLAPLHARSPVAEPGLDAARVHVGRLDDVGVGRDELIG